MFGDLPILDEATSWDAAQRDLAARDLGDGLPLVPPTRRRLDAMLSGMASPERSLGAMPPLFGELTPAAVAYNCVLAGCAPGELPVVLAAAVACLDPAFNLLGVETTTGTAAVAMMVHGPAARRLGMNSGTSCLGPGNRANAAIGRALRLVLLNVGGARPGVADMATMGQPGKYMFAFAENDEQILAPFHVRRGYRPDESAVSVLAVSGTVEIVPRGDGDTPEAVLGPMALAMAAAAHQSRSPASANRREQVFALPPELARLIAGRGWTLERIVEFLHAEGRDMSQRLAAATSFAAPDGMDYSVAAGPGAIHPIVVGGPGLKMTYLPLWSGGTTIVTVPVDV